MADTKITDLTALTGADSASTDIAVVVDVSDTSAAASGTNKKMTLAELAAGLVTHGSLATDSELSSHESDTTSVHGISDTSALATTTDISTHSSDTTSVHGITDTSALLDTSDIGVSVQAYDADTLKADTADQLTAGFTATDYAAGTKSSGTFTPDAANGNFQTATNGGAHTLAPPSASCTMVILYTNNGSAGTITTSGFTQVDGDALDTTDTNKFVCYITKIGSSSVLTVKALQ